MSKYAVAVLFVATFLSASFISISTITVSAQSVAGNGSIRGVVKDSTGAIIPGAKITVLNPTTGQVINSVSNSDGNFILPPITIGSYKIRIELTGMKAWESDARVEAARTTEVIAVLEPGNITETVVVPGSILPMINTTDATDGSTLDSRRIEELPLNGRSLNKLLEDVTPGVENFVDVNAGVRIGGLMTYSTDFVQDGASSNNREFGGSANIQGLSSVAEVRVETSTSSAKINRPTSVIVTTKSGSNQLHFSAFETHRNNAFGVARARQDVIKGGEYKIPKLIRNEFGGNIGGPVFLPTFGLNGKAWYNGTNRTFFFFSQEGFRFRQGLTRDYRVPTEAMRNGDFSGLVDANGNAYTLYDPMTTEVVWFENKTNPKLSRWHEKRDPFPNNQLPINRMSPLAKFVFGITPLPNIAANPLVGANYRVAVPTQAYPSFDDNPTTVRIDHNFTQNDSFFIKVNGGNRPSYYSNTNNPGVPTLNNEANVSYLRFKSIAGAMSWTHTFSPNFFVETLFNRSWIKSTTSTGPEEIDYSEKLGLPNPYGEIGWPQMISLGISGLQYAEADSRRGLNSKVTNIDQNYSLLKGSHKHDFGFRLHSESQHLLPDQGAISGNTYWDSYATALNSPTVGSPTSPSAVPFTRFDLANFFLGYASYYEVGLKKRWMQAIEKNYGFYYQDSWKVNNRLTLTPGLRWDLNPSVRTKNNAIASFSVEHHKIVLPESLNYYYGLGETTPEIVSKYNSVNVKIASAEELGLSKKFFKDQYFDIGPRAGFAYRLFSGNKETVIRGGYGMYISPIPMRAMLASFAWIAPFRSWFSYNSNDARATPDGIGYYLIRNKPSIIAGVNSRDVVNMNNPASLNIGNPVYALDGNQANLKIHELNLSLEKEFSKNTAIKIRYNYKHGVNADQYSNINAAPSEFIWLLTKGEYQNNAQKRRPYDTTAYSDVSIMQKTGYINTTVWSFEIERRFTKGLGFQAFYTLTNALRMAGNYWNDDQLYPITSYLPGTVPDDPAARSRFLNYDRDTSIPKHRIRWNWNYELPFGKGKSFGGNAHSVVNGIIGGWKFAGSGTITHTWFAMPTGNWGKFGNFAVYGKKHKIWDCRETNPNAKDTSQEICYPGYLWFNGYIPAPVINKYNQYGVRTGVFGLPENYKAAQLPLNPYPQEGPNVTGNSADYGTSFVRIMAPDANKPDGKLYEIRIPYNTGLHPWRNQYKMGPFNFVTDMSMHKYFNITERAKLRVSIDVFNVFNIQGYNSPNGEGIVSLRSSFNNYAFRPRQMQASLRLDF